MAQPEMGILDSDITKNSLLKKKISMQKLSVDNQNVQIGEDPLNDFNSFLTNVPVIEGLNERLKTESRVREQQYTLIINNDNSLNIQKTSLDFNKIKQDKYFSQ